MVLDWTTVGNSTYHTGLLEAEPLRSFRFNAGSTEVLVRYWLQTAVDPRPSWEAVVAALRSPVVDKKCIAEKLESMYCASVQHAKESNGFTKMEKSAGIVFSLRTYF